MARWKNGERNAKKLSLGRYLWCGRKRCDAPSLPRDSRAWSELKQYLIHIYDYYTCIYIYICKGTNEIQTIKKINSKWESRKGAGGGDINDSKKNSCLKDWRILYFKRPFIQRVTFPIHNVFLEPFPTKDNLAILGVFSFGKLSIVI